jgi:3-hydroxyisobutyrate dehydrogenase
MLDSSLASSAILKQRGPVMRTRQWTPAPGPIETLHAILEQIEAAASACGADTPVFTAAKAVFDKAMADGWAELDIAAVHAQLAGETA